MSYKAKIDDLIRQLASSDADVRYYAFDALGDSLEQREMYVPENSAEQVLRYLT